MKLVTGLQFTDVAMRPKRLLVAFLAIGIHFSTLSFSVDAAAQSSDSLSPEGINNLIDALQNVEQGLGSGLLTQPNNQLDRVRERAAENFGFTTDDPESAERTKTQNRVSADQRIIIERFCRGEATVTDRALVQSVRAFSRLEREYCQRGGEFILQYGYEAFDQRLAPDFLLNGAIHDGYVMGRGDELVVGFRGREARTLTTSIDREGRLVLPDFQPIQAAGLTFGELRIKIEQATRATFIGTDVFVSLGSLRRIGVLVAGEVASPGLQQMTSETTLIDAIGLAGGVLKSGSLRRIVVSSRGRSRSVDLYGLLTGEGSGVADFVLNDGDRIVVPAIGSTVAIAGDVTRPAVFELPDGNSSTSLAEVLRLAGNTLRPRGNRITAIRASERGGETILDLTQIDGGDVEILAGDLVMVEPLNDVARGGVTLSGDVRLPGRRVLASAPTISQLIAGGDALASTAYLPLAVLETNGSNSREIRRFAVDLSRVIERVDDFFLKEDDRLVVFSTDDIRFLSSPAVQRIVGRSNVRDDDRSPAARESDAETSSAGDLRNTLSPQATGLESILRQIQPAEPTTPTSPGDRAQAEAALRLLGRCKSIDHLSRLVRFAGTKPRYDYVSFVASRNLGSELVPDRCPEIFEAEVELLPFLLEYGSVIRGEVRRPGVYPVVEGARVASVLAAAGGITRNAHTADLERAGRAGEESQTLALDLDPTNSTIQPGDIVRVNPAFSEIDGGQVRLVGEFVQPGTYSIKRGETLSQLVARASGLTRQAYPYGAVFTRESVRIAEERSLQRLARELSAAVTVAAANRGIDPNAVTAFAALTRDIAESPASGRVVIEADPVVLNVRPELDIVLEPGDQVFIPRRPNSVLVTGDVLNPGAMQFVSGRSVESYIRQAGGFQQSADQDRVFVVLPNGVAQPVSVSPFVFSSVSIPPGSTIIVPKDATPFNAFTIARELSSVLSQLAITAASLAVIGNN